MSKGIHLREFVLFQLQRNITNLYKNYIILSEELHREHKIFLKKLADSGVSKELIKKLDYFDDSKYTYIRKRVLDLGNEINRDLEKYFDLVNLELNEKELEQVQKDRLNQLVKIGKQTQVTPHKKGVKVKGKLI
tara:strand:+ start:151 stop:552 length:402 start_codon:yes stop_codon:yes gene_type:complete